MSSPSESSISTSGSAIICWLSSIPLVKKERILLFHTRCIINFQKFLYLFTGLRQFLFSTKPSLFPVISLSKSETLCRSGSSIFCLSASLGLRTFLSGHSLSPLWCPHWWQRAHFTFRTYIIIQNRVVYKMTYLNTEWLVVNLDIISILS